MQHEPFLRWAGGKRWLVHSHPNLFPAEYNNYIEPFLGSGAVFFYLTPANALLCDANSELIDTYRAIKEDWAAVRRALIRHKDKHSKEHYYAVRSKIPKTLTKRAARFIYLNRSCWNGLYRVNQKGEFNVPLGIKHSILLKTDDFKSTAELLKNAELKTQDFAVTIEAANEGDLLFVDPPYTVKHNINGFIAYNEHIFKWADQVRLRDCLFDARDRGVQIILSNADHECIHDLYKGFGSDHTLQRISTLAGDAAKRKSTSELILCSN